MNKLILVGILLSYLTGCATSNKVTVVEKGVTTTYTEKAFIAAKVAEAQAECYDNESSSPEFTDARDAAIAYMAMALAGKADKCNITNSYDADIAKSSNRHNTWQALFRGLIPIGIAKEHRKSVTGVAKHSGGNYTTTIGNVTQSTSNSGSAGGEGSLTESGLEANSITIGGNSAVAGERSAAGDTALVNGDSSALSNIKDSEQKQSPTGDDQQGLDNSNDGAPNQGGRSGFDDGDGSGNSPSLL